MLLKKQYILFLIVFVLVAMLSCENETQWNIDASERIPIVDAIITNENKVQEVRVYYSSGNLNTPSRPFSGASVIFTDGEDSTLFTESVESPGLYQSPPIAVASNINYSLIVKYDSYIDSAAAAMVPVSELRDYEIEDKEGLKKYNDPGSITPSMTEVLYDWSAIPEYCNLYGACMAAETYYTINIIDISKEFAPDRQEILFPTGTKVYRKKYSLSPAHQEFVRSLLIETEWRGGIFDIEQGNIPTNFTNGSRGWFAVCQVLNDSTVVQ